MHDPLTAPPTLATITIMGSGRLGPTITALVGLVAAVLGGLFLVAADGGPGTGDGVVASAAAIVLGLIAIGLDRIAATRAIGQREVQR